MVKYTYSTILYTLEFIKKMINIFDVVIQLCYIMYVIYRIVNQLGISYMNNALLVLTSGYLIYYLLMFREFYTKKQLKQKTAVKNGVKILKYIIYLYLIIVGVVQIYQTSATDNMTMLMIVLMIIGYVFSIMFDIIRILINNHIKLIESSILYDIKEFKNNHKNLTALANKINIDLDKVPVVDNEKMLNRIIDINNKRENKRRRKEHFKIVNKKPDNF